MTTTPPRERWVFLGRERHYGSDYLVWELANHPRMGRKKGQRWARQV